MKSVSLSQTFICLLWQLHLPSSRRLWPVPHGADEVSVHVGYLGRAQTLSHPGWLLLQALNLGLAGNL